MSKIEIDNISSGYRPIKNGKEYDKYFPKPNVEDKIIIEDGEVDQTVNLMKKVVWRYIDDTKQIAKVLKGNTIAQSCDNVWNFLYHHIQYRLDKAGLEQLRRPARSWYERNDGIDCDCFSIFASSILTNMGIQHSFRIAKYNRDVFQHVYVIVPIANKLHIIDPVLSQKNHEKIYTQKKDFIMSLEGINVAVLSGESDQDLHNAIMATDLNGVSLGNMSDEQDLQAIYNYLISTRNAIAQNPHLISYSENPEAFIKMLDYAIKHWNTPNRDKAIAILAKNEERINAENGISGIDDNYNGDDWELEEELLGSWFSKKRKKRSGGFFSKIKKAFNTAGKKLKQLTKVVVRYNPLTASARAGFLLALKFNIKGMASKLKWGYATKSQAARKGISASYWSRSQKALKQVEHIFADKLQGTRGSLKKSILNGKAGNLNGVLEGNNGLDGIDELGVISIAAAGTLIAAATPVIVTVMKVLKNVGLMNKGESSKITKKEMTHINKSIPKKQSSNSKMINAGIQSNNITYANNAMAPQETTMLPGNRPEVSSTAITFLKKPIVIAGGLAVAGGIGYLIFAKTKHKSSLKGVSTKRKKSRTSSKIKTIKLS